MKAKVLAIHGHEDPLASNEQALAFCDEMRERGADFQLRPRRREARVATRTPWQAIDGCAWPRRVLALLVTDEVLREIAEGVQNDKFSVDEWQDDYDDPATADLVRQDAELAADLELPAEPAVVVSGPGGQKELIETPTYEQIAAAIDEVRSRLWFPSASARLCSPIICATRG